MRNDWFPGYKTYEGVPAELLAQFDAAEDAARALGMTVWRMDRYEADAHLIKAAPDLLAACAVAVAFLDDAADGDEDFDGEEVLIVLRMAIAQTLVSKDNGAEQRNKRELARQRDGLDGRG